LCLKQIANLGNLLFEVNAKLEPLHAREVKMQEIRALEKTLKSSMILN
jgi:hypothetical protein